MEYTSWIIYNMWINSFIFSGKVIHIIIMATVDDLKMLLKDTLDNRGVLNQVRARIRAEIFSALDDQSDLKPVLSNENMLINELIREYLEFNNYKFASSVLLAEAGQPKDPIDRKFLLAELNIKEANYRNHAPLLYGLVYNLKQKNVTERSGEDFSRSPKSTLAKTKQGTSLPSGEEAQVLSKGIIYHGGK